MNADLPIAIAAGGQARRMNGKPFKRLSGVSLIELALQQAVSMSASVAVAVQELTHLPLPSEVKRLYDEQTDAGPLSTLSSALRWGASYQASHILLIPCDMPFLPDDLLARLGDDPATAAVKMAKSNGRLHPICALWPVTALSALPGYAQNSRRSLMGFAKQLGMAEVEWPADPVDPFFNINTVEDLIHAQKLLDRCCLDLMLRTGERTSIA